MKKLSIREKLGYSAGEYAGSVVWQALMFFLPIFYTDTFGLTAAAVSTMFLVVRLFDALNDPLMGTLPTERIRAGANSAPTYCGFLYPLVWAPC